MVAKSAFPLWRQYFCMRMKNHNRRFLNAFCLLVNSVVYEIIPNGEHTDFNRFFFLRSHGFIGNRGNRCRFLVFGSLVSLTDGSQPFFEEFTIATVPDMATTATISTIKIFTALFFTCSPHTKNYFSNTCV